jgi:hypothetical protein
MAAPAIRKLWKGSNMAGTVVVRGTSWTFAPMFMVHQSRVPYPDHKKMIPIGSVNPAAAADRLAKVRTHRPGHPLPPRPGHVWRHAGYGQEVVTVAPFDSWQTSDAQRCLVGFDPDTFIALRQICAGCELRFDVWSGWCSWWNHRASAPFPVAVLAGYVNRPYLLEVAGE